MKSIKRYNNTTVEEHTDENGKSVVVRLHGNFIFFKIIPSDKVLISNGNHPTQLTVKRLNECFKEYDINLHAYRKDGVAYVDNIHGTFAIPHNGIWIDEE